ncbi:hypothetical protein [Endozoicomonas sp. YOMI1]|uniref:hypothetical protein n=1 Tax=Endozoicomonas sp. YOMI1 TaxID=2828739 RepID=UPI002148B92D|nr:hypothetical protein [Endozoicomonas sp. YOMI1]
MMNTSVAIIDRFVNSSHYLWSSEFKINPKANIFTPLRKVSSKPAENNYLPLAQELKFEIAKHLNLKDFAAFSSINVDNYLSLRSDDLLVEIVIQNEDQKRLFDRLEDLKKKAQQYHFDIDAELEVGEHLNAVIPTMAICSGPSQLIFNSKLKRYTHRSFDFVKLFQYLCLFVKNDSTDDLYKAQICKLVINLNNRMNLKVGENATAYALYLLSISIQISQLTGVEDKCNKLSTLANMIENEELNIAKLNKVFIFKEVIALSEKNEFDWDIFLNGLRSRAKT